MNAIFKKLNYKAQSFIYILNAPASFKNDMEEMKTFAQIKTSVATAKEIPFLLAFVTKQKEVDDLAHGAVASMTADGLLWVAYPKGTSKKYKCEFNRDNGWTELGKMGFEPVRMVAIDEDWSALRFRNATFIKKMTRSFAMSDLGKKKVETSKSKSKK